ncbi:MAG: hypothetical protein VX899_03280 [Myxococcota bacterium]|nr:hypothetical protein [Myxococcota bacterium]
MLWLLLACEGEVVDSGEPQSHLLLPEHSQCFEAGHVMDAETCLAVVEEDGRQPTVSENKSGQAPDPEDPRLEDPELLWLAAEIERCTCVCCHKEAYGGPGVYFYDMDFSPVWIDSASTWSLNVLSGETNNPTQSLPSDEPERVLAIIEAEIDRRYGD